MVSATSQEDNVWMGGELAVYGRVVGPNELQDGGAPLAVLPRTASILIPESASPDFRTKAE